MTEYLSALSASRVRSVASPAREPEGQAHGSPVGRSAPLVVALDHAWAPFSFVDELGEPRGMLIDLWRELEGRLGRRVAFRLGDWGSSLELVYEGLADVHGGLLRSARREEKLAFSVGLLELTTFLFVAPALETTRLADLGDLPLGVVSGSYEKEYVESRVGTGVLSEYANNREMIHAAIEGEIRAFVADYPVGVNLLAHDGMLHGFRPVEALYTEFVRVGVPFERRGLLSEINSAIEELPGEDIDAVASRHNVGDAVLAHFVSVVSNTVRRSDIVARYGGEEFAVIFSGSDRETASGIGSRILSRVAESVVKVGSRSISYTASCGIAACDEYGSSDGDICDSLVEVADERLYTAKRRGRNQVADE